MEAIVMNTKFETIAIIDQFESFIWTDRYFGAGEFELYLPAESKLSTSLKLDNYLWNANSDHVMIVENVELNTDPEVGDHLTVTGQSLESILLRRVIWDFTELSGNVQTAIQKLLNENAISPTNAKRKFPNLTFKASTDPKVTSLTFDAAVQYHGELLYDAIYEICEARDLGFRITLTEAGQFQFELYAGVDHSWEQTENPCVVFSPRYDNLLATRYTQSKVNYHNAALVMGEGDGKDKITVEATNGDFSGLDRREVMMSSNSSQSDGSEEPVEDANGDGTVDESEKRAYDQAMAARLAKYKETLVQEGKDELAKSKESKYFDGEVEARRQFVYGQDFKIGDIVQVSNEYNMQGKCRVLEFVMTQDASGETMLPTFSSLDTSEEEDEDK